jgi:hypothetical protein
VARQTIDIWDSLKVPPILLTLSGKKSHRSTWSMASGYHVVITHGNGPQVGSEQASDQVPAQTLDVCGVASQGEIGYLLSQSLPAELFAAGLKVPVVSGVTQSGAMIRRCSEIDGEQIEDSIRISGSYSDVIVVRHPEAGGAQRAA